MAVRLTKPWQVLSPEAAKDLPGQLGIYEIGDADGNTLFIGYASGRSLFGLRGELEAESEKRAGSVAFFRVEINTQYLTRYRELLMVHIADHGEPPVENASNLPPDLGRLDPA